MANPMNYPSSVLRGYVGVTVTLTSAATNYRILDLINAVLTAETGTALGSQCPGMVRELSIQVAVNDATVGVAAITVGDGKLSATRIGYILVNGSLGNPGASRLYRSTNNNVDLSSLYVRCEGSAAQQLYVEVETQ